MQPQRNADPASRASRHGETRRELRGNVIQWRQQAEATRHLRQLPLPAARRHSSPAPVVSDRAETVILLLVAIGTAALVAARFGGVL